MGTSQIIRKGDIQVMSAGTGIFHSELNKNKDKPVKFLQIWVIPDEGNVIPRYGQLTLNPADRKNKLQTVLSPDKKENTVWIHQNAWFSMGDFDKGVKTDYIVNSKQNGVYAFILEGDFTIAGERLNRRDGIGITETDKITIEANSDNAQILLMDVPMIS